MPASKSKYASHRTSTKAVVTEQDHHQHLLHAAHGAVHAWIALIGGVFAFLTLVALTASTFAESRAGQETSYQEPQDQTEMQILKKRVELLEQYARRGK